MKDNSRIFLKAMDVSERNWIKATQDKYDMGMRAHVSATLYLTFPCVMNLKYFKPTIQLK